MQDDEERRGKDQRKEKREGGEDGEGDEEGERAEEKRFSYRMKFLVLLQQHFLSLQLIFLNIIQRAPILHTMFLY